MTPRFVMTVVLTSDGKNVICQSIDSVGGKLDFPEARVGQGESVYEAATRALLQETGVMVSPTAWHPVFQSADDAFELNVLAAMSGVTSDESLDSEMVFSLDISEARRTAAAEPQRFIGDFFDHLGMSEAKLRKAQALA